MRARSSCDACNTRKTKCDLAEKKASNDSIKVSCSFCSSLNLPCRVTKGKQTTTTSGDSTGRVKHKKGKRIRELLASTAKETNQDGAEEEEEEEEEDGGGRSEASRSWQSDKRGYVDSAALLNEALSESNKRQREDSIATTASKPRLLGIPGLSTSALQNCLDGYFDNLGLWMALSQERDLFMKRYQAFLRLIQGAEVDQVEGEDGPSINPVSEMLVLAVASRGAPYTRYKHLETALLDRTLFLTNQPDNKVLEELDGIEAVTTLAERNTRPLHLISPGDNRPNFLVLDPFGKGFSAELCLFTKLNEESPPFSSDYHRRNHLFWVIFCHDAVRSASACRMYRLHDEDVGWPMRIMFHRQPIVALAFIARKICRIMLSSRARCLGIDASDIMSLLDDLAEWPRTVNISVEILNDPPSQSASIPSNGINSISSNTTPNSWQNSANSPQAPEHQARVKQCIVLGLWLRLTLSIWTALHEVGYLASSPVMMRAEEETARAARRMMKLAERCITFNIVDHGPNALLTTSAAWILYCARKLSDVRAANSSENNSEASLMEINRLLELANVLLRALRSAKTRPEAEALARRLEGMLQRANPIPLVDISRLAESSTAQIQAFDKDNNVHSKNASIYYGGTKSKAGDENLFTSGNDSQYTCGVEVEQTLIDATGYLQGSAPHILDTTTGSWPTPETPFSSTNASWTQQNLTGAGNQEQATKRLAPNYPTGLGVAGDEDFLKFMAVCGFDSTPSFLGNFVVPS